MSEKYGDGSLEEPTKPTKPPRREPKKGAPGPLTEWDRLSETEQRAVQRGIREERPWAIIYVLTTLGQDRGYGDPESNRQAQAWLKKAAARERGRRGKR